MARLFEVLFDALFDEVADDQREAAVDATEDLAGWCLDALLMEIISIDPDVRASAFIELQDLPDEV